MLFTTGDDVIRFVRDQKISTLDFRFTDLLGGWHHFSSPARILSENSFAKGFVVDASSFRGWAEVHQSDMVVLPDAATAILDPFFSDQTMVMICDVVDPVAKQPYRRDPRNIAKRAEAHLQSLGFADKACFGPEGEFFIFDSVRHETTTNSSFYEVDSEEGSWNTSKQGPCSGIRLKEGYFPVPPLDRLHNLRNEIVRHLEECGIAVEKHHHEVAGGGQCEIDIAYDTLTRVADKMMLYKYICKSVAQKHQKIVTFMPKPLMGENGTAMHVHFSLWRDNLPLFDGKRYADLSDVALYAVGGLLKHARSLLAFACPTTNSYRRLVPGYEAPVRLAYSTGNRSACCRIPIGNDSPAARRVEFRPPDPSANPYLCFASILMAALDGIANKIDPGKPFDKNMYQLTPEELRSVQETPRTLDDALDGLEQDHAYLLQGGVFNLDIIKTWIDYKRNKECESLRARPHPHEFHLYFDA
jgi:glutamine synthetase